MILLLPDAHICDVNGGTLVVPHDGSHWAVIPPGDWRCQCRDAKPRRISHSGGASTMLYRRCVHMEAMRRIREMRALPSDHPADCPHCARLRAAVALLDRPEPAPAPAREPDADPFVRFE